MTKALALDLEKLQSRAFDRADWAEDVLRRCHAVMPNLDEAIAQPLRACGTLASSMANLTVSTLTPTF